jgi:hypothetical protein
MASVLWLRIIYLFWWEWFGRGVGGGGREKYDVKMVTGLEAGSTVLQPPSPPASTLPCDSDRKRAGMKQISEVERKPFTSSLNICPEARDGIFKSFRSPAPSLCFNLILYHETKE